MFKFCYVSILGFCDLRVEEFERLLLEYEIELEKLKFLMSGDVIIMCCELFEL